MIFLSRMLKKGKIGIHTLDIHIVSNVYKILGIMLFRDSIKNVSTRGSSEGSEARTQNHSTPSPPPRHFE